MTNSTFHKMFFGVFCFSIFTNIVNSQTAFTNSNTLTPTATHSGCAISVSDINNDGLDDIVKMDQSKSLVIDMQNQNGSYTHYNLGAISASNVWGMAVADIDHNGWKDIATGNNGAMYLVKLSWTGSTIAKTIITLTGSYFVQNITFGDFDNDGWVDLAVCDDNNYMKIYKNNSGTLAATTTLINTNINPGLTYGGDPYDSGNYGSVWLDIDNDGDLDLYIAHCRQSTSSYTDQRRRDRLFKNNGSGVFTESAASTNIEPVGDFKQSWTSSFGDLDNDGDMDVLQTNHGENSQIFKNNGSAVFTDVTAGSGFSTSFDAEESILEDFDNDGWLDIFITAYNGSSIVMYHNNGDGTYTNVTGAFGGSMSPFLSFATGDLNHDGFIDIEASYGSGYNTPTTTADVLWLNNKNSNHFITFNLTGTASNQNAIGAKVTITGAFGTQVREVRSGETYGTSNSLQVHFGLGSNTEITSAVIEWPAGGTTTFGTLSANQFVTAVEGTCTITGNIIPGPFAYCTGGSVTLNAQPGYTSYLWSNGATTSAVTSTSTSNYNVLVSAAGCSNLSPTITTVLNPIETPTVTTSGVNSCAGTLTLTSSTAAAYNWTGPAGFTATTQSINPTTTGTYSLTTTGLCQNWTAAPTVISVLASPSPTATGASGPGPATYNLSAAGSGTVNWYATASGGVSLGTGVAFTTPTISTTTTYYIDQTTNYPGATNSTGKANGSGSAASTLNGGLDFNVIAPCTLTSVKVYATTSGTKTIQLKNSAGTVLNSYTTGILPVDSSVITLNFPLIPGTGYRLTQSSATTTQLKRNNTGATYPYSAAGYVTITNGYTGTTTSSAQYYYYYDWKITAPTLSCTSTPRVPVVATVTPSVSATSTLGSQILCNGGTTTVTVAGSGGTPPYTGEGVFTVGAGIHNFTVTDATSATFVTTITVTEPALLISNYVSTDPTTCSGANGAIDLTITGGTSAYTFLWSNGASTQNISGLAAGVYSYTVTDANGCTSNASSTLSNPPAPSVTVAIPVDTACTYNAAFVLTGGSPIGGIFTGAGVTLGSFNPSAASAGFNVITYTYTDSNGCFAASTDNIFVDVCAGISSISEPLFNIYPNPTSGMLNIETEANENTISLFDVLGNVIYSVKSSSLKTEIDMQNFADGIYFLKVANSKTVSTMRIIRSK